MTPTPSFLFTQSVLKGTWTDLTSVLENALAAVNLLVAVQVLTNTF